MGRRTALMNAGYKVQRWVNGMWRTVGTFESLLYASVAAESLSEKLPHNETFRVVDTNGIPTNRFRP